MEKKAGMLTLAFLIIAGQSSCGTDKVQQTEEKVQEAAEAPAEEQEETQPEITREKCRASAGSRGTGKFRTTGRSGSSSGAAA